MNQVCYFLRVGRQCAINIVFCHTAEHKLFTFYCLHSWFYDINWICKNVSYSTAEFFTTLALQIERFSLGHSQINYVECAMTLPKWLGRFHCCWSSTALCWKVMLIVSTCLCREHLFLIGNCVLALQHTRMLLLLLWSTWKLLDIKFQLRITFSKLQLCLMFS